MITPEKLLAAGWKKMGNAWYHPGAKKGLTNFEGKWQLWLAGVQCIVTKMEEI